jgi:hypothetical protein
MNNRVLGTIGMICAPGLLFEALIPGGNDSNVVVGICSMIFMIGSFASHFGLWRIAASGRNWWGRGVLGFHLFLVTLAFLFGVIEAGALLPDDNILFTITDMAWPLSMVWMLPLGITIAVVKKLEGWKRFVSLFCGFAFPGTFLITTVFSVPMQSLASAYIFYGYLAVVFIVLGWVVSQSEPLVERDLRVGSLSGASN